MPIVQMQVRVVDFPLHFRIDSTMLPPIDMGAGTLDQHKEVYVTARLGKPGQIMPANGDLDGSTEVPVKVGANDVKVVLTKVIQR